MALGLVDYGSGSESEGEEVSQASTSKLAPTPATAPTASTSNSRLNLSLPLPKSSSASTSADRTQPPKKSLPSTYVRPKYLEAKDKQSGPKKFFVGDDPTLSTSLPEESSNEPPKKKPRIQFGDESGEMGKRSGLAALLPPPKATEYEGISGKEGGKDGLSLGGGDEGNGLLSGDGDGEDGEISFSKQETSTAFVPLSMMKGRGRGGPSVPKEEAKAAPKVDFFSIGEVAPKPSSTSLATPSVSSTISSASAPATFSSAPPPADVPIPPPKADDPYPGYYQLPDGSWAARPETLAAWEAYNQAQAQGREDVPRGFSESDMMKQGGVVDIDESLKRAREEVRAGAAEGANGTNFRVPEDAQQAARGKVMDRPAGIPSFSLLTDTDILYAPAFPKNNKIGSRARSRHQLSSLITEATENRAELEERIARAKANKRAGGSKYGF